MKVSLAGASKMKVWFEEPAVEVFSHASTLRQRMIRVVKTFPSHGQAAFDAVPVMHLASAMSSWSCMVA